MTWNDLMEHTLLEPEAILDELKMRGRYDLVKEWINVFGRENNLLDVSCADKV